MSNSVTTISTLSSLKYYLSRKENLLEETFEFLPTGALLSRYGYDGMVSLISDLMSMVNKVSITTHTVNKVPQRLVVTVRYRACARMLKAWQTGRHQQLTATERQALQMAMSITQQVGQRKGEPLEKLYLLYSYVNSTVQYQRGDEKRDAAGFVRLTGADHVLLNRMGNCQGYAEVMYLCGSMLGFRMGVQCGYSKGKGHCWNVVEMGNHVYALDASVTFNTERKHVLSNCSHFLMGQREATAAQLTCRPEQEVQRLSVTLAPAHDYYRRLGRSFDSLRQGARFAWKQFIAGEKETPLRLDGHGVTLQHFSSAMDLAGDDPDIQKEIFRRGKSVRYRIQGTESNGALYVTVAWAS